MPAENKVISLPTINPRLLMDLGHIFTFNGLRTNNMTETIKKLKGIKMESYQTLGKWDFIVKYFETDKSLPRLLTNHVLDYTDMQPWRVTSVARCNFENELDYVDFSDDIERFKKIFNEVLNGGDNLEKEDRLYLIDNNYLLKNGYPIEEQTNRDLYRSFVFVKFEGGIFVNENELVQGIKSDLFPKYRNIISGIYVGERMRILLECESAKLWPLIDFSTKELHDIFLNRISTETFFVTRTLFKDVKFKASKDTFGPVPKPEKSLKEILGATMYFRYQEIKKIIKRDIPRVDFKLYEQKHEQVLEVVTFYSKHKDIYCRITNNKDVFNDPSIASIETAMAHMLAGIFTNSMEELSHGVLLLTPILERVARIAFAWNVVLKYTSLKAVRDEFNLPNSKKTYFRNNISSKELRKSFAKQIKSEEKEGVLDEKVIKDWDLFSTCRNTSVHGREVKRHPAKEYGPLGFYLIDAFSQIIPSDNDFPEQLQ